MIEVLGVVLRGAGALLAWAFVIRYARYARGVWTETDEGRHLMGFTLIVAIFMTLAVTTRFFGPFPGLDIIAIVLFLLLDALLVQRNLLLLRAQRRDKAEQGG
jgi:hypothetical protein